MVESKTSQKILAISDTTLIPEYQRMIDNLQPDIVVLAGDYDEGMLLSADNTKRYFYDFLHHTGKKSKVLVIKGNHDDSKWSDSTSHYSINKINSTNAIMSLPYQVGLNAFAEIFVVVDDNGV